MTTVAYYICTQIEKGALQYNLIVPLYPQFKEEIDICLTNKGLSHLIVEL